MARTAQRARNERSVTRTLERVGADLDLGHTFVAIQRLTTLVQQQPTNLDLRARLSAVHLRTGNLVEAGRWGYLGENRDPEAQLAFEKAFRTPVARLNALRWRGGPHEADTVHARVCLLRLIEDAGHRPERSPAGTSRVRGRWTGGDVAILAGILGVVSVWLIGALTVVHWLV
jgi:hypothetical protein